MFKNFKIRSHGFTLIEIMVAIGIIVILTGIIIMSAESARKVARDNQRIADIQLLQLKLEAFKAERGSYPASLDNLVDDKYIPSMPKDPKGNPYSYSGVTIVESFGQTCSDYHLGVALETSNSVLQKAKHRPTTSYSCGSCSTVIKGKCYGGHDFGASDADVGTPNLWYDVVSPNDFNP